MGDFLTFLTSPDREATFFFAKSEKQKKKYFIIFLVFP